jgi:hypothetical protein
MSKHTTAMQEPRQPNNPVNKPYSDMNRTEKRQHKRWLIKSKSVDLAVLREEGSKEQPLGLTEKEQLQFMADDYNRILGKVIWRPNLEMLKGLEDETTK